MFNTLRTLNSQPENKTMVPPEENSLLILNDDCIYKILEWTAADDLCSCSRTCKRMQVLCNDTFRRKFQKEVTESGSVMFRSNGKVQCQKYVKYFDNFIKALNFYIDYGCSENDVIDFIQKKCDPNLRHISIFGCISAVDMTYICKNIENFLQNVENVRIDIGSTMAQIAKLLKYCPNLTKISLFTETPLEINTDEIFEQKYPKLRHIHWLKARPSDLKTEKLRQFLQENDQIQCMEWSFRFMDEADIDMLFPVIRTIVDCAPHLQHLYLKVSVSFHYWDTVRFSVFCDYLKILCGRNNFKSLYLNFRDDFTLSVPELFTSHADSLAGFKQLTQIQIHIFHLPFRSLMQSLLPYVHLRSLILRQPPTLDNSTETITLPQIEEIFINDWTREDRMVLMQFVRYWVNLKKIIIHDTDSCCETVSEVAELNLERTKLKDACELTIYTDTKGTTTNLDHKLVKLKYVKFEYFDSFAAKCMLSVQ